MLKTLKTVISFSLILTNKDILDQQATLIEMVDFDKMIKCTVHSLTKRRS